MSSTHWIFSCIIARNNGPISRILEYVVIGNELLRSTVTTLELVCTLKGALYIHGLKRSGLRPAHESLSLNSNCGVEIFSGLSNLSPP